MRIYGPTGERVYGPAGTRLWGAAVPGAVPAMLDSISTSSEVAYGLRLLRALYTGAILKLRRASDDAELDFWANPLTLLLDLVAIAAWAGGDSFCKTLYDQSGNGRNATQATTSKQLKFNPDHGSGAASLLGIPANSTHLLSTAAFSLTQTNEIIAAGEAPASTLAQNLLDARVGSNRHILQHGTIASGSPLGMYANSWLNGSTDRSGSPFYMGAQFENTSSKLRVNGVSEATGVAGASSFDGITIGANVARTASFWGGDIFEILVFDSLLSPADRATVEANQALLIGL